VIGEYDHKIIGEQVDRKTLDMEKMPEKCTGKRKILGPPVSLPGVDSEKYEVRKKTIGNCGRKLTNFIVKQGKVTGI
jgi:hypothetical protein